MSKKDRIKSLLAEARGLQSKAVDGTDLTPVEIRRVATIRTEIEELSTLIGQEDEAKEALKSMVADDLGTTGPNSKSASPLTGEPRGAFAKALVDQVKEKAGTGDFKAVTATGGSVVVPVSQGVAQLNQSNYLLSNLVTIFPYDAPDNDGVSYLRQTGRTLAATTVARGKEKPNSDLSFEGISDAFATVAHLAEVPNQFLESFSKFAQVIEFEMLYGLSLGLDDLILNGGVDENGDPIVGLLGMTGVKAQVFMQDKLRTIRRAIGSLQAEGTMPTAVVLHPEDWEEIETTKLADGDYLLDGVPTNAGQPNLWGVPVQLAPAVGAGRAVVGAFDPATIGLANRGGVKLQWNPFKLDHLNKTVLRTEGRFVPVVARPGSFAVADLTA